MNKSDHLLNKIDKYLDEFSENDCHNFIIFMADMAQLGRYFRLLDKREKIEDYFQYSPEVFEYIKDYRPMRLMKFLERIK